MLTQKYGNELICDYDGTFDLHMHMSPEIAISQGLCYFKYSHVIVQHSAMHLACKEDKLIRLFICLNIVCNFDIGQRNIFNKYKKNIFPNIHNGIKSEKKRLFSVALFLL